MKNSEVDDGLAENVGIVSNENYTPLLRPLLPQIMITLAVGIISFSCGISIGHTAVLIPRLRQNDSSLPTDEDMGSWIASAQTLGMVMGNIVGGALADRLGRRMVVRGTQVPYIIGWVLTASATSHGVMIFARLVLGLARGMTADAMLAKQELIYFKKRVQKEQLLWKKSFADYCRALRSRQVCKPFTFSLIFFILNVLCGTQLFVYYTVDIIATALRGRNHHMDEFSAATIAGFLRLVMTMVTCALLYVVRRRMLLFISGIGTASCMLILGIILQMNSSGNLISELSEERLSLTLLFLYVCFSSVGLLVVPFLMMGEMLPNRIRGFASGVICSLNDILMIGVVKIYPWYNRVAGIEGVCWLFGGFSVLTSVFVYLFIPETQGKSLAQIEEYFQQYNILWVTRPKISHKGLELSNRTDTDKLCKEAEDGSSLEKSNPISNRDHILSQDVRS
ncbi:facilitated trehalose transporter Tret1-like isoform X2 [Periplaneta americana]|uniref:facilitated trehalose transporter Tret1-like isoform X2 n=1 Tax=Periplaneta americana TaxID=6978 RepID=UPI0037E83C33